MEPNITDIVREINEVETMNITHREDFIRRVRSIHSENPIAFVYLFILSLILGFVGSKIYSSLFKRHVEAPSSETSPITSDNLASKIVSTINSYIDAEQTERLLEATEK